ncbi:MAG TPA: hypothetical protein PLG50_14110, partial [bacterium]|nr:hypothetical protein [bacterium]
IGGRLLEATPAQAARYDVLHAQAASALRQVRAIDPNWRPAPSLTSGSIEGEIARLEGELRETEAHLRRITPLDFNGYNHYARFGRELHNATRRAGYDDVELYMRGSSVTGRSFSKGTPFRSKSDYDVAIVSPTMMRRAEAVGVEIHKTGGRTRWALTPDQEAALGLSGLSRALTQRSGHPTSVMIYRSQTVLDDRNSQDREVMRNRHGDAFAKEYRSYRRIPIE